jgi:hypothetical protein
LRRYLEFLLWHYRVVDAFWFLYLAETFDQPTAERIGVRRWHFLGGGRIIVINNDHGHPPWGEGMR